MLRPTKFRVKCKSKIFKGTKVRPRIFQGVLVHCSDGKDHIINSQGISPINLKGTRGGGKSRIPEVVAVMHMTIKQLY